MITQTTIATFNVIRITKQHAQIYLILLTYLSLSSNYAIHAIGPNFLEPLSNITISKGRDALFTCSIKEIGGHRVSTEPPRVAWIKADAKAILAIHEHVITNNARLVATFGQPYTWTLMIKNVEMEDAGRYMCQINTDPMSMQSAYLEVVVPPDIDNDESSSDYMVPEGGSAKLVCKATGHPKPKITWRREDGGDILIRTGMSPTKSKVFAVEGEELNFPKVTRSEMGNYLCIATNGIPPSVSRRIRLQVHFRPMIQVPNQLVGAPVETDVTLICNAEASPRAINYWQRVHGNQSYMVIPNERFLVSENDTSLYNIQMVLKIIKIQTSDFGNYKCVSKNSIGGIEASIRLYEMNLNKSGQNEVISTNLDYKDNSLLTDEELQRHIYHKNNRIHKGHRTHHENSISSERSSTSGITLRITQFLLINILNLLQIVFYHVYIDKLML